MAGHSQATFSAYSLCHLQTHLGYLVKYVLSLTLPSPSDSDEGRNFLNEAFWNINCIEHLLTEDQARYQVLDIS